MEIPVIITYFGGSPRYLIYALRSAAKTNADVLLIGDDTNINVWGNHWNTTHVQSDKWRAFMNCYVQMSDYTRQYEIGFWKRMFFLETWMVANNVRDVFMVESDVVTFLNYSMHFYPILPDDCIAALLIPKRQDIEVWAASTAFSYWTIDALDDFTTFCLNAYRDEKTKAKLASKYQWHIENRIPGGVSEMTLLYFWSQNNPGIFNFCRVINDMTIDVAVTDSHNYLRHEYQMKHGLKRLIFKNGIPHAYNKILQKEVKFGCIHCNYWSKPMMRFFYSAMTQKYYWLFIPIVRLMNRVRRSS